MIGELLDRTRGRAFVLFTSYTAMRDVQTRLEKRIGWPLLVQGTAPRTALLCLESDPAACHRRIVAEALRRRRPDLRVVDL